MSDSFGNENNSKKSLFSLVASSFEKLSHGIDRFNQTVDRTQKKQRATSELKLAISNESTLIEAALMSAKREIEREQFGSGLQPDELKRFDQHHLELTQGYSGKHIDENDGLKQLPNAEIPKFDYPNRDPDDRTADAIEGEIRSLKEQRSRRLVRLITELAADHELAAKRSASRRIAVFVVMVL